MRWLHKGIRIGEPLLDLCFGDYRHVNFWKWHFYYAPGMFCKPGTMYIDEWGRYPATFKFLWENWFQIRIEI